MAPCALICRQPVGEFQQAAGGGRYRETVIRHRVVHDDARTSDDLPRVDIQPGARRIQQLHLSFSRCARPAWSPRKAKSTSRAHRSMTGQHYRVLAGLRVTLTYGLDGTKRRPTSLPACVGDSTLFHVTGCDATRGALT